MAVIAILLALAIPSFRAMQQEAKNEKAKGGIRTLKMAVQSYYNNYGDVYPPGSGTSTWEPYLISAYPQIINAPIYDPFAANNTTQFGYKLSPSSKYFIIFSVGSRGTGIASINNSGNAFITGDAIWESNGPMGGN